MIRETKRKLLGVLTAGIVLLLPILWLQGQETEPLRPDRRPSSAKARQAKTMPSAKANAFVPQAGRAGVVVISNDGSIQILDPNNNTLSANFLAGELGTIGGGLFDVVITPDGRTALVSNFGDSRINFIDISHPAAPVFLESIKLSYFAEDIALTPDGKYALVTDGGFSMKIASIHVPTRTLVGEFDFSSNSAQMQSVAVAADGRTVLSADYWNQAIQVVLLDPANGNLTFHSTVSFPGYRPVNVAISPNGRTAIAAVASTEIDDQDADPVILSINGPGNVVQTGTLTLPPGNSGGQSVVFARDSRRAYYLTDMDVGNVDEWGDPIYNGIVHVIVIQGPGQAVLTGSPIILTIPQGGSCLFGVDVMAIEPLGRYLYVANKTLSGATNRVAVVNLRTNTQFTTIDPASNVEDTIPVGIAFVESNKPPVAVISVDKSELILDIGEIATFDGSASYDPEGSPLNYDWSLVSAPAGAVATLTPAGAKATLTPDPNLEGTYQVGLVVNDDIDDSNMAMASVVAKFYPVLPPVNVKLQRLENNFIFYIEYINKLTWQANPENKSTITNYKLYKKVKGAADSSYALVKSFPSTTFIYEEKGLSKDQLFTYKLISVNSLGRESDPVVVSN